jgi:hypothetical protein
MYLREIAGRCEFIRYVRVSSVCIFYIIINFSNSFARSRGATGSVTYVHVMHDGCVLTTWPTRSSNNRRCLTTRNFCAYVWKETPARKCCIRAWIWAGTNPQILRFFRGLKCSGNVPSGVIFRGYNYKGYAYNQFLKSCIWYPYLFRAKLCWIDRFKVK